jgi:hypothetical protein
MSLAMAKLCTVAAALAVVLPAAPSHAENFAFVSSTGSGGICTTTAPCANVSTAVADVGQPVRVICVGGAARDDSSLTLFESNYFVDIDCPQGSMAQLHLTGPDGTARVRHFTFRNAGFANEILLTGSGNLILEDCVFADATGVALDIEPNGPLNLVIRNCRISSSGSGMLLKPAVGGSITATLDHVAITQNTGGGIKIDTTNGLVAAEITECVISSNGGNGINAIGSTYQDVVSIKSSVIARNGAAGIQSNGANAGVLVSTTLLDQNAAGATSVVAGGHLFTYGNNDVVGSIGSGFTATAMTQ